MTGMPNLLQADLPPCLPPLSVHPEDLPSSAAAVASETEEAPVVSPYSMDGLKGTPTTLHTAPSVPGLLLHVCVW